MLSSLQSFTGMFILWEINSKMNIDKRPILDNFRMSLSTLS